MKHQLFIWTNLLPSSHIRWLEWNPASTKVIATGSLDSPSELPQLKPIADKSATIVLLPGECCLHTQLKLPNRSKLAKRTIPFQFEEKLCQPVETMHIVYSKPDESLNIAVLGIEKTLLQSWIDSLESAQIQVDQILPDYLALPLQTGLATLIQDEERILCRTPNEATTLDKRTFNCWWSLIQKPENTQYLDNVEAELDDKAKRLSADSGALEILAQHFQSKDSINLLQGEFEQRNPLKDLALKLKIPTIAASLFILLQFTNLQLDNIRIQREISNYDDQIEQVFKSAFPNTRRVINPRSQMKAKLAQLNRTNDQAAFIRILGLAGPVISNTSGIKLQQMRFQADNSSLKIYVTAPNFMALEKLSDQLQSTALRIKPGAYHQNNNNEITGQLTLWENKDAKTTL